MVFSRGTALIFFAAMGKPKGEEDWQAVDLIRFAIKSDVYAISVMGRLVLSGSQAASAYRNVAHKRREVLFASATAAR
jgi:hypothetical protein